MVPLSSELMDAAPDDRVEGAALTFDRDRLVDRVLRRIREVLTIVLLCLLIVGLIWMYATVGTVLARLGDSPVIDPVPAYTGDPYGEDQPGG